MLVKPLTAVADGTEILTMSHEVNHDRRHLLGTATANYCWRLGLCDGDPPYDEAVAQAVVDAGRFPG